MDLTRDEIKELICTIYWSMIKKYNGLHGDENLYSILKKLLEEYGDESFSEFILSDIEIYKKY